MLIRFNVRNFLSFSSQNNGSTEEFSMITGKVRSKKEHIYDDGKIKLLKFAADTVRMQLENLIWSKL